MANDLCDYSFVNVAGPATPPHDFSPEAAFTEAQIPQLSTLLAKHSIKRTVSPPTPAASPQPAFDDFALPEPSPQRLTRPPWSSSASTLSTTNAPDFIDHTLASFKALSGSDRHEFLAALLLSLGSQDLLHLSTLLAPLLKRDFLTNLPAEIGLQVLGHIDDPRDLIRASSVCKSWRKLVQDDQTWKTMCERHQLAAGNLMRGGRRQSPANLPGVMSLQQRQPIQSRTGFPLLQTPTQASVTAAAAAAESPARPTGEETPVAPTGMSPEQWAMHGLGIVRQTPRTTLQGYHPISPDIHRAASAAPFQMSQAGGHRQSISETLSSPVSLNHLIPLESPVPMRPITARNLSIDMPSAPRLGQSPIDLEDDIAEESPPSPTPARVLIARESVEERLDRSNVNRNPLAMSVPSSMGQAREGRLAPAPLPLVLPAVARILGQQPQTTITLSPRPDEVAPTDASRSQDLEQQYAYLSSSTSRAEGPLSPGDYSKNPFGMAKIRPSSRNTNPDHSFSYQNEFKRAYLTESNWLRGPGRILSTQAAVDDGVVTSLGFDQEWIVVGMATKELHIFDAETGDYVRSLVGHTMGIWALALISRGGGAPSSGDPKGKGRMQPQASDMLPTGSAGTGTPLKSPPRGPRLARRPSSFGSARDFQAAGFHPAAFSSLPKLSGIQQANMCGNVSGWGQTHALVVSAGCDRTVRLWDVTTGDCLQVLEGHTSTVRCLRVVDGRPIAVTGSRDTTVRVWDLTTGRIQHVMTGHLEPVRCLEISGMRAVSGSYDNTARLWDLETGECVFVFAGHYFQIYAVAFDGQRVVTGSLDSTVRIWSARTGDCLALLQGHTSLVGQLQLTDSVLVTGGSDGRVIVFSLATLECLHRICAHDNSVTCLQFDHRFIVTGGNDGRVKLFDFRTGQFIRELAEPCEAVWRITFREDKCVILCKRLGRTTMSVITFRPEENEA